jgi:sialate O-acetylesterase
MKILVIISCICLAVNSLNAQLRMGKMFNNNMVLQREKPIHIFGKGIPTEGVTISFLNKIITVTIKTDSTWEVYFEPQKATKNGQKLTIQSGAETIILDNILVGDVWLCAGQSNMEFALANEKHVRAALKTAFNPNLRLFNYKKVLPPIHKPYKITELKHLQPEHFYEGNWSISDSSSAKGFSAVAYYFGQMVEQSTDIPIGLIHLAIGGSPLEAWLREEATRSDTALHKLFEGDWMHNPRLEPWCILRGSQNLDSLLNNNPSVVPKDELGYNHLFKPSFLSKAIQPFTAFPVKGFLWYQGESNSLSLARAQQHERLFPLLVADWRKQWGENLPFYFCQLSSISTEKGYKSENWGYFRDSQRRMADSLDNVGMAVTSDVGHPTDVHPTDKKTVGERLAKVALAKTYQKKITFEGPKPLKAIQKKDRIIVYFNSTIAVSEGQILRGVSVEAIDGKIQDIPAILKKRKIIITTPLKVKRVLYGWKPFSDGNLINTEGLPCSTFALSVNTK